MISILMVIHSAFLKLEWLLGLQTESKDAIFFFKFGLDVLGECPPVESGSSPISQKTSKVILNMLCPGLVQKLCEYTKTVRLLSRVF